MDHSPTKEKKFLGDDDAWKLKSWSLLSNKENRRRGKNLPSSQSFWLLPIHIEIGYFSAYGSRSWEWKNEEEEEFGGSLGFAEEDGSYR